MWPIVWQTGFIGRQWKRETIDRNYKDRIMEFHNINYWHRRHKWKRLKEFLNVKTNN